VYAQTKKAKKSAEAAARPHDKKKASTVRTEAKCKHGRRAGRCKVLLFVRCACVSCAMPVVCLHRLTPGAG